MKVPGQRSSFHICDILDLNTTTSETKNNAHNSDSSNNVISSDTSFPSQTSNSTSTRDDTNVLSSTIASIPSTQLPPPPAPYQIGTSLSNSMYSELGHHYQSILPTVTRSWLKETENYGMYFFLNILIISCEFPFEFFSK